MLLNLFEIKCKDYTGEWYEYYYCKTKVFLRGLKMINYKNIPINCYFVMDDRSATPIAIRYMPPLKYLYYKYFRRQWRFRLGKRINWKKEFEEITKIMLDKVQSE